MFGRRNKKKPKPPVVCAVIVAAGSSRRMGGADKLLMEIAGAPVIAHTLKAFENCVSIRDIVLVCREQDIAVYASLSEAFGISKLRTAVRGGDTRTESAFAGLKAAPEDADLIAVHDGARPLVSEAVITEAVNTAMEYGAAAPVVPLKDSIKRVRDGVISADVPRESLRAVQTPQVFRKEILLRALESAVKEGKAYTDDCAAAEALGQQVRATHGSYDNIKITTPEDVRIAKTLLEEDAIQNENWSRI